MVKTKKTAKKSKKGPVKIVPTIKGKKGSSKAKAIKASKAVKRGGKKLKGDPTLRAVEGQQLTERQIKAFVAQYKERGNFPGHKMPCTISGRLTTAVGPWLRKKVAEFKGVENLLRNYKCRGATKKIKPIKEKKVRRFRKTKDTTQDENKRYDVPIYNPNPIKVVLGGDRLIEDTKTTCQKPNLYLDNGKNCNGCGYYDICLLGLKCLPKWITYSNGEFVSKSKK